MEEFSLENIISFDDDFVPVDPQEDDSQAEKDIDDTESTPSEQEEADDTSTPTGDEDVKFDDTSTAPKPNNPPVEGANDLGKIYDLLKDSDLLEVPEGFEFDGTPEKLEEAIDHTFSKLQEKARQTLLEALDDETKLALKFVLTGNGSIKDYYDNYLTNPSWEDIDMEEVDSQKFVVTQYLKNTTKFTDAKIKSLVAQLESEGKLEKEAKDNLLELISLEEQEKQQREKQIEEREVQLRQERELERKEVEKIVDQMETIPTERKSKLKGFINNELNVRKGYPSLSHFLYTLRQIGQNKEHMIQLADLIMDYNPDKGINLDRFEQKTVTKSASKIRQKLDAVTSIPSSSASGGTNPSSNKFDWNKWAKQF